MKAKGYIDIPGLEEVGRGPVGQGRKGENDLSDWGREKETA